MPPSLSKVLPAGNTRHNPARLVTQAVRSVRERTAIPTWYQVHPGTRDVMVDGVRIPPLPALCREVGIP